jgi:hypothetical protein
MNPKQSLVVLGTAVLCGFAIAQTPKTPSSVERLDVLEKEVLTLREQAASASSASSVELAAMKKELAETHALADQLASWASGQALGAADLARVLDDSEQKGFTFGINPESRVALLTGWRNFATSLQKDVPKAPVAIVAKDAKAPARKNP